MRQWLLILALAAPALAWGDDKPKSSDSPAVWPPPADDDSASPPAKKQSAKDKKGHAAKDAKPKDDAAAAESSDEPLPRLAPEEDPTPAPAAAPEPPEDPCDQPFEECRDTCTIEHTNDDTTLANGRKPLLTCLKVCHSAHDSCEERRKLGLGEKSRDEAPP